jgi:ABC-2 type transport system ATP-binding protein
MTGPAVDGRLPGMRSVSPESDPVVVAEKLSKRYGRVAAVAELSFTARPGRVTGFFGPNGAGKTTALKMVTGLARASSGAVWLEGRPVGSVPPGARSLGVHIEPCGAHPGRTGRAHLRMLATLGGLPRTRVDQVLTLVELGAAAADRRVGTYSMGMRQRLGLAAALLGDPRVLVLDEPVNGLDPRGVRWLRELVRAHAARGNTVLLSSHVLSEAAHTVDDVVVVDRGRTVYQGSLAELAARGETLEDVFLATTGGGR